MHSSAQTESSVINSVGVDEAMQIDATTAILEQLRDEVRVASAQLIREREKSAERERLLIAQMNAIRDQQLIASAAAESRLTLTFTSLVCDWDTGKIPPQYSAVFMSVLAVDTTEGENIIGSSVLQQGQLSSAPRCWGEVPFNMQLRTSTGQIFLKITFHAKSDNESDFPILLGEWNSAPFVPCMKEKGRSERFNVRLPLLGSIQLDLLIT